MAAFRSRTPAFRRREAAFRHRKTAFRHRFRRVRERFLFAFASGEGIISLTMSDSFYPDGQGNQIDWNTNIIGNSGLLTTLGFTAAQVTSITNDCQMAIYLLSNVGEMADSTYASLHGFAKSMEKSALGTAAIPWPTLPTWPTTPPTLVAPGIGARRSAWVATAKKAPNYNPETNGRTLRLEFSSTPFNPTTYVAELKSVEATGHETVQVKIGKGGGQVTAAQLQMKRGTDTAFKTVGQFTGRSYVDHTPLAQPGVPESRQYQLLAMKNDVVIGLPSPILTVVVS